MTIKKFKPLDGRVLVKLIKEQTTESGIIIATEKDEPEIGEVVAVADDIKDIKVGDEVFFGQLRVRPLKFEEGDFYILERREIKAILK